MTINKKTKIAVLCGGISDEREVSIRSGKNCFSALKSKGYKNILLVDVKNIDDIYSLKKKKVQVCFLVTHGKYGEDGTIQGVLEWLKIPYTGSSLLSSAISMDKLISKQIAMANYISCPKFFLLTKDSRKNFSYDKIWKSLSKNGALFLKPRGDGSSVNTFKIKSVHELIKKIKTINLNKSDYLIEEFIPGVEVTSSVIEVNKKLKILPILELRPKNEFYDYEAKYKKGMTDFVLPAEISSLVANKIKTISLKILSSIGCSSPCRVDFIIYKNEPYFLEVNSLPGMTNTSDLPAQAKCAGISYDDLVEIILHSARLHM